MHRLIWNPTQVTRVAQMEDMASWGQVSCASCLRSSRNLLYRLCLDYFIHRHRLLCRFSLHQAGEVHF